MSNILKSKVMPIAVIWAAVLIVFAEYFFGGPVLGSAFRALTVEWGVIIANIAIVVGGVSLIQRSVLFTQRGNLGSRERIMQGWQAFTAVFMFVIGITLGTKSNMYTWVYNYVLLPSWQTVYSIIIFFMATATYRAYKANSAQAVVFMVCSILVLLRNAPVGSAVWGGFFLLGNWVLDVVNMSATRAVLIGSVIGALSLLIKVLIGKEKILGQ